MAYLLQWIVDRWGQRVWSNILTQITIFFLLKSKFTTQPLGMTDHNQRQGQAFIPPTFG